jgi:hypothetical protein
VLTSKEYMHLEKRDKTPSLLHGAAQRWVPQLIPLFALIQPDEQNRAMAILLQPNEALVTGMR